MPISLYLLESDGTIPGTIVDGGYYGVPSGLPSPQDWTFLGVSSSPSGFTDIPTLPDLVAYLTQAAADNQWGPDQEGNPFDPQAAGDWLWAQQ